MQVKITLTAYHREQAATARIKRGLEVPPHFEGPEFKDVKGTSIYQGFYWVNLRDGTNYAYRTETIERIKESEDPEPDYDPLDDDLPF